jgi:predicted oxidoreductase
MYGEGRAEGILGELAPSIRNRIILTSKAGILPTHRSVSQRLAERGLRGLRAAIPPLKEHIREPRPAEPRFGAFKLPELLKSVETSLRELRTDHLDILLMHECTPRDLADPQILDFLHDLKRQGKIREFGVATGVNETAQIAALYPSFTAVVQMASSIWDANVEKAPALPNSLRIAHSCLGYHFHKLVERLRVDANLAEVWRRSVGIDPLDPNALAQLFLAQSLRAEPNGLVLFSSSKPENIEAAAKTATDQSIGAAQLDRFVAAVSETIAVE